jgi:predicted nucleic acid-binding protein
MMLVDTNVLIALLVSDRPEQAAAALQFLEEARDQGRGALVSESVLLETCWVLERSYGLPRFEVAGLVGGLIAAEPFRAWDPSLAHTALSTMRESPALSITDCLLAALAKRTGATVLTFDRGLRRATRRLQ